MRQRRLGRGGPEVSAIGLGCMGMSFAYGPRDDVESSRTLHRALDLGVTFLDTADMYGNGHNERIIGASLDGRRDEFFLATKFGIRVEPGGTSASPDTRVDTSAAYVRQACDASLSRLGFDTIDLYYAHRRNPETPIEETVGAMAELVAAGKVRYLGLSEVNAATLRAAHAVHPITALQVEYSLFSRQIEGELLDTCRELGIAVVAYAPIGRGMLTGTLTAESISRPDDYRRTAPRFAVEHLATNLALVDAVRQVADGIGVTPAQAALAWLLTRDELVIPIPGTKRVTYLEENTAAAEIVLAAEQLAAIEAAAPADAVVGDRYAPAAHRFLNH